MVEFNSVLAEHEPDMDRLETANRSLWERCAEAEVEKRDALQFDERTNP